MPQEKKVSIFKNYLLNSSFHGYRFIVEEGRHWTERVFWTICCVLSWIATGLLIYSAYDDFKNNAISFVVDTNYLDWDTNFPSVVVCETDQQDNIAEITDKVFGDPHDYNLDEIVKELVFYKGLSLYTLQICGPDVPNRDKNCFVKNLSYYHDAVRSPCQDVVQKCKWNDEEFDCCAYFKEIDTELGRCYGLNSLQTREKNPPKYKMVSNKKTGPGNLYLNIKGLTNLYVLGPLEIPSLSSLLADVIALAPNLYYRRYFSIKEIDNQPEVKYVSIDQRKCRFPDESDLDVSRYYSYSACCVQCRKKAQLEKCGCIHHLMPNTSFEYQCTLEGIKCLNEYYNEISVLKASWSNRTGLVCGCLPSCNEIELSVIRDDKVGIINDFAVVELTLERLPTERFKRNVVRGKLDLVVSMGGATALFLGASLLSFIEIFHFFLITPISDYVRNRKKIQNPKWTVKDDKFGRKNNEALPSIT
ncbi:sodium channel protein Nach [Diabrotica undecimpunctata]|uniref:sodium channel protein Nach n=1 Tax=Diabrotica undecimpunctata TaxID=50387 RepID=UPI003B634E48